MLLRRLAPLAALVVVGVMSTGCADQSAAVTVGDRSYSDAKFREDLEGVSDSDTLLSVYENLLAQQQLQMPTVEGATGSSSYSQEFVQFMLSQRISALLVEQVLEEQGVEVPSADRDAVRTELEGLFEQSGEDIRDVPKGVRDRIVDEFAGLQALQTTGLSEEEVQGRVDELLGTIEVNSRYGEWDPDSPAVLPPVSPLIQDDGQSEDDQLQLPPG